MVFLSFSGIVHLVLSVRLGPSSSIVSPSLLLCCCLLLCSCLDRNKISETDGRDAFYRVEVCGSRNFMSNLLFYQVSILACFSLSLSTLFEALISDLPFRIDLLFASFCCFLFFLFEEKKKSIFIFFFFSSPSFSLDLFLEPPC